MLDLQEYWCAILGLNQFNAPGRSLLAPEAVEGQE